MTENQAATLPIGAQAMLTAAESFEPQGGPISADSSRAAIVSEARSWLGTPYRKQQARKRVGADCYGLALGVGVACRFASAIAAASDPDCKGYGDTPNPEKLLAACTKYLVSIQIRDAVLGDLYLMRWEQEPHHFAIISRLNSLYVIHAYAAVRRVVETPIDGEWRVGKPWRSLIVSAWRYRELAY